MSRKHGGWFGESGRHSLASRGYRTGTKERGKRRRPKAVNWMKAYPETGVITKIGKNQYLVKDIQMEEIPDETPDLSFMGEYSDTPKEGAIDRKESGDWEPRELRYFNPAIPEYADEDYKRMEAYNDGQWNMVGIQAVAEVHLSQDDGHTWNIQRIKSPGLWGIESDSDDSYKEEVYSEQLGELKKILKAYNFGGK